MAAKRKFFLGASMAGHQVDGGAHDQWTAWEEANADRLAAEAEKKYSWLPNWSKIKKQATDPANYRSEDGVRHKQHFREDFDLAKQMGLNSLRFGMEWAELQPHEGEWNQEAIDYYHEYLREMKKRGLEPFVTLWHWTHPQWFEAKGGMTRRENLHYFEHYAQFVIKEFGEKFKYLIILNEPNVYVAAGWLSAEWPPQNRSPRTALRTYRNLMKLHNAVYKQAKRLRPQLEVGIAMSLINSQPKNLRNPLDRWAANFARYRWNWWFLDNIHLCLDFVGVNHYMTEYLHNMRIDNPDKPINDMGWYMQPAGLEVALLQSWQRYEKPLIITENGLADAQDKQRAWWIQESLLAVERAQKQGADVRGYLHWSLLDNFEWSKGWWPKFGLISVDRSKPDMPRKIRKSASVLK